MKQQSSAHETLQAHAKQACHRAYAPYSQFPVGAALLMKNGDVISGCNVENASYGLSNCAERTAVFNAIAQGYDAKDITEVVIFTPGDIAYAPCGACRQVLAEFLKSDAMVYSTSDRQLRQWRISELLPDAFTDFQPTRDSLA